MTRLPTPGQDSGEWGDILNDFLGQAHTSTGAIKPGSVSKGDVGLGNVNNTSDTDKPVSAAAQTALNAKVNTSAIGAANGIASLDGTTKLPISQLPAGATISVLKSGGSWPVRPTARTDIIVRWKGASPGPTIDSTYALDNVDDWDEM